MLTNTKSEDGGIPNLTFRLVSYGPTDLNHKITKEIFIIRHGQSKWNVAKAKVNVNNMLTQYDHELTLIGIDQAVKFNKKWKELKQQVDNNSNLISEENKSDVKTFLSASLIFSSPLTRALQTTLLTCEDHPAITNLDNHNDILKGITLLRNLREVKSGKGSFDTVGSHSGQQIGLHVKELFNKDIGIDRTKKLMIPIFPNDTFGEWWTNVASKDSKDMVKARFRFMWSYLRYGTNADTIILVGHSTFFIELLRQHLSQEYKNKEPVWTQTLMSNKLDNASGLRLTVEWNPMGGVMDPPIITKAKLIFDTKLKLPKQNKNKTKIETTTTTANNNNNEFEEDDDDDDESDELNRDIEIQMTK